MFKFFLVSSVVHFEKNALSEAAWILSEYISIEKFSVRILSVGGLSMLTVDEPISIPNSILDRIANLRETEGIRYCSKIIPLEDYFVFSEEKLVTWVSEHNNRISEHEKWRITINKRHNNKKSRDIIDLIAKNIKKGTVDLKNPDKIIQIEIIGKYLGIAILDSYQIIQFTNLTESTLDSDLKEESIDNDVI